MATATRSRSTKSHECVWTVDHQKPLGPRQKKWAAEVDTLRKAITKMKPESKEFADTEFRLFQLCVWLHWHNQAREVKHMVARLVDRKAYNKALALERIFKDDEQRISLMPDHSHGAKGVSFYASMYVNSGSIHGATAETLPTKLAELLRRESAALAAMADRVEEKAGKAVAK